MRKGASTTTDCQKHATAASKAGAWKNTSKVKKSLYMYRSVIFWILALWNLKKNIFFFCSTQWLTLLITVCYIHCMLICIISVKSRSTLSRFIGLWIWETGNLASRSYLPSSLRHLLLLSWEIIEESSRLRSSVVQKASCCLLFTVCCYGEA